MFRRALIFSRNCLLRAVENARSRFIDIEHLSDKQIELIRTALEKQAAAAKAEGKAADQDTVDRLLDRF